MLSGREGRCSRIEGDSLGTLDLRGLKENISFLISCQGSGNTKSHQKSNIRKPISSQVFKVCPAVELGVGSGVSVHQQQVKVEGARATVGIDTKFKSNWGGFFPSFSYFFSKAKIDAAKLKTLFKLKKKTTVTI